MPIIYRSNVVNKNLSPPIKVLGDARVSRTLGKVSVIPNRLEMYIIFAVGSK
jgi:hypothetical protein